MKLTVLAVCKVSKFWFLWLSMLSSFQMFLPYTSPGTCLINRAPPLLSLSLSPLCHRFVSLPLISGICSLHLAVENVYDGCSSVQQGAPLRALDNIQQERKLLLQLVNRVLHALFHYIESVVEATVFFTHRYLVRPG